MPKELYSLSRSHIKEVSIYAEWAVKVGDQIVMKSWQQQEAPLIIARSLLKPLQMAATSFTFEHDCEALGLASHSGEKIHEDALLQLQAKVGVSLDDLVIKPCYPMDGVRADYLRKAEVSASVLFHPCCGKHLLYAAQGGAGGGSAPYQTLESANHKRLTGIIKAYLGHAGQWTTDSCGLPTLIASMSDHLKLWSQLASDQDTRIQRLISLWQANPVLTGGRERLDSQIMLATSSHLLAKEGADGLLLVQSLPASGSPSTSILIKLAAGYNASHLAIALAAILEKLPQHSPTWDNLRQYLDLKKKVLLPGDQTFASYA